MQRSAIFAVWVCIVAFRALTAQEGPIASPQPGERGIWRDDSIKFYHPLAPTLASLLLPGAGQFYTRHYVKGGFFTASEGILGAVAYSWRSIGTMREFEEKTFLQKAHSGTVAPGDSVKYMEESFLRHHDVVEARLTAYDFIAWSVGAHVFNVMDALGGSNFFRNTEERNPRVAGLLAAVPGLGLGQLYNGSISKAGFVMMFQTSLGIMAYNSKRLMDRAEANYVRLNTASDSLTKIVARDHLSEWGGARNRAFTNRNMYLWYSVFFYFYSVLDAVVDAYLHDYPEKMKIEPDLMADGKGVHFSLQTLF